MRLGRFIVSRMSFVKSASRKPGTGDEEMGGCADNVYDKNSPALSGAMRMKNSKIFTDRHRPPHCQHELDFLLI